jgi:excisionase family DNA binding protein
MPSEATTNVNFDFRQTAEILTVGEVARELRVSKAHVHNLINGKVHGVEPLPSIKLGRRRLIRRSSLNEWLGVNECYDSTRT